MAAQWQPNQPPPALRSDPEHEEEEGQLQAEPRPLSFASRLVQQLVFSEQLLLWTTSNHLYSNILTYKVTSTTLFGKSRHSFAKTRAKTLLIDVA